MIGEECSAQRGHNDFDCGLDRNPSYFFTSCWFQTGVQDDLGMPRLALVRRLPNEEE